MRSSPPVSPAVTPAALEETFVALGDPVRLAVIGLLCTSPRRSSDLADALGTSRPTMSRHLSVLRRAALVEEVAAEAHEDARVRTYQLRRERFDEMRAFLDEIELFWGEQLASFKDHVEKKHAREKQTRSTRRD